NIDEDCDGQEICYVDADGDGYRPDATSTVVSSSGDCRQTGLTTSTAPIGDCDDMNPAVYVGALEKVGDGIDEDCDTKELCYVDADGDGLRPDTTSTVVSDDLDCTDPGE